MGVLTRVRAVAAAIVVGIALSACGINNVPTYEEQAKAAWSEVQNQYQRRADLIPNLVETVKGYARQEQETLTRVVEARAKATSVKVDASTITDPAKFKEFQDAQNQLSGALGRLIAVSEAYPDLKASEQYRNLMTQLEGTENRIGVARRDYNATVADYNTSRGRFPGVVFASMFGFQREDEFKADPGKRDVPAVDFSK